ncbi:MAG: penicillin-binding protein 2 [Candidatus Aminicenantaceae bacterium]
MDHKSIYEDLSLIIKRSNRAYILVNIFLVFLVFYFWKVQIIDHNHFWNRSEANRIREATASAPRGLITDREGAILADNIASFKVSIIRENCKNFELSCQRVSRFLNMEEEVLKERIEKYEFLPPFKPIVIKENLTIKEVSMIEARKLEFPEIVLQTEPKRFYPFKSFAAHTIGYLQELSLEDIKSNNYKVRSLGELIGKTGIEKEYDSLLRGEEGKYIEVVDNLGRIKEKRTIREPVQGSKVKLTLDYELQKRAEELLEGKEGAVIVLDAQNGEILALANYPTYDPNKFINRFTPEEWIDLINNPEFPLENRAIRGLYAPGSVFKLTVALSALDLQLISDRTVFSCNGRINIYSHPFSCWFAEGHGPVNLTSGIKHSCNIYFYNLGKRLGIEEIARYSKMLGFGERTGIDLPDEKEGLIPTPEWKKRVRNLPWYPGETISVSIGQGPILVTPIQVAVHTSLIANRGESISHHLLKSYFDPLTEKENMVYPVTNENRDGIKSSFYEKITKGMYKAVNEGGTARLAMVEGYRVCGKTGSTQIVSTVRKKDAARPKKEIKTHSWFTGFAPQENPKVVVTVLVEYGGMGGETAAPIAKELFELHRKRHD